MSYQGVDYVHILYIHNTACHTMAFYWDVSEGKVKYHKYNIKWNTNLKQ